MSTPISNPAKSKRIIENQKVIVTKWTFNKLGDHTTWHKHLYDYVVVPLFDGQLEIDTNGEISQINLRSGEPYFRGAGVEHDVINANSFPCEFIEIELKDSASPKI